MAPPRTPPQIAIDGELLVVGRRALHALRQALTRDYGDQATAALQEAGYAAGDQVYDSLRRWTREWTGVQDPGELDAQALRDVLSAFFDELGWGAIDVVPIGRAGLTLRAPAWAESEPESGSEMPTCHFTAGMLAGLLGHLAARDVAVMEVECRSRGDAQCQFVAGSAESLQSAYEALASGGSWEAALGG